MEHLAIMKKEWHLLERILSGEKRIESRWYSSRREPWGKIKKGEKIFFKNSGEPVTVEARVERVLQFEGLSPAKVGEILERYGEAGGIRKEELPEYYPLFKGKRYCILVFLKDARRISPLSFDKRGFGSMAAWISAPTLPLSPSPRDSA